MKQKTGLVYFVSSTVGGVARVKIGFTRGDPTARLRALQCGSPLPLGIYTAFEGDERMEKAFHQTFAPLRLHGEWFEVKGKLLDFLLCLMDDAMERKPANMVHVLEVVELVILATEPIRETDDPEEYLASADTSPWEWMRKLLAEEDAKEATLQ
jgi:hypothetical protein